MRTRRSLLDLTAQVDGEAAELLDGLIAPTTAATAREVMASFMSAFCVELIEHCGGISGLNANEERHLCGAPRFFGRPQGRPVS